MSAEYRTSCEAAALLLVFAAVYAVITWSISLLLGVLLGDAIALVVLAVVDRRARGGDR